MKKLVLSLVLFAASFLTMQAQESSGKTLGVRLGDNSGFGGEISYQFPRNDSNRIELNLGLRNNSGVSSYKLTGTYQWVWDLDELNEKFNWYAGFGAGLGSWKADGSSSTFALATVIVGIEYDFDIPLLLSLDIRPEFGFNDAYDGLNSDIALGVRYQF